MSFNKRNSRVRIEFSGTPGSGKSSIIRGLYNNNQFDFCQVVTTGDSPFDYRNSNFELIILWHIFDTYTQINRFEKNSFTSHLTLFDRGLFDRMAWVRLLSLENPDLVEIATYIENWLKTNQLLRQTDIIFLILTSYEKAKVRKGQYKTSPNQPSWVVNPKTIQKLNEIYFCLFTEFREVFPIVLIDDLNQDLKLEQKQAIINSHLYRLS